MSVPKIDENKLKMALKITMDKNKAYEIENSRMKEVIEEKNTKIELLQTIINEKIGNDDSVSQKNTEFVEKLKEELREKENEIKKMIESSGLKKEDMDMNNVKTTEKEEYLNMEKQVIDLQKQIEDLRSQNENIHKEHEHTLLNIRKESGETMIEIQTQVGFIPTLVLSGDTSFGFNTGVEIDVNMLVEEKNRLDCLKNELKAQLANEITQRTDGLSCAANQIRMFSHKENQFIDDFREKLSFKLENMGSKMNNINKALELSQNEMQKLLSVKNNLLKEQQVLLSNCDAQKRKDSDIILDLRQKLEKSSELLKSFEQQLISEKKVSLDLRNENVSFNEMIKGMKSQNDNLFEEKKLLLEDYKKMTDENSLIKRDNNEIKGELIQKTDLISILDSRIAKHEKDNINLSISLQSLEEKHSTDLDQLNNQINGFLSKIKVLTSENESMNMKNKELEIQIKEMSIQIKQFNQEKLSDSFQSIEKLTERVNSLRKENTELSSKLSLSLDRENQLLSESNIANSRINKMLTEKEILINSITDLKAKMKDMSNNISILEKSNAHYNQEQENFELIKLQNYELTQRLSSIEEQLITLRKKNESIQNEYDSLQEKYHDINSKLFEKTKVYEESKRTIVKIAKKLQRQQEKQKLYDIPQEYLRNTFLEFLLSDESTKNSLIPIILNLLGCKKEEIESIQNQKIEKRPSLFK